MPLFFSPPSLCSLPLEILDNIAFFVACPTLQGPPVSLTPLLLSCKTLHESLGNSAALYTKIFKYKFSFSAISRRSFSPRGSDYLFQLQLYTRVLKDVTKRAKTGNVGDPAPNSEDHSVEDLMWILWAMCLEDDGCNRIQMNSAGVYHWVEAYVRQKLYAGSEKNNGWPIDNAVNACSLHVLWYLTTKERLLAESPQARDHFAHLLLPFVTVPYRYASSFAPPGHFELPLSAVAYDEAQDNVFSIPSHGPYPIYLSGVHRTWRQYFYSRRVPLTIPLITDAAKLLFSARRELFKLSRSVINDFPVTRHGVGPTQSDFMELNEGLLGGEAQPLEPESPNQRRWGKGGGTALTQLPTFLPDGSGIDESGCASRHWDKDWTRLRSCLDCSGDEDLEIDNRGVYTPGDMSGLWVGRLYITSENHFEALLSTADRPMEFTEISHGIYSTPVYMRLAEHVSTDPQNVVEAGEMGNGWFPNGMDYTVGNDGVEVTVPKVLSDGSRDIKRHFYRTFRSQPRREDDVECCGGGGACACDREGGDHDEEDVEDDQDQDLPLPTRPQCRGSCNIQDVLLTGSTDERHGKAWNHYTFHGRVRSWDGCVGLARVPRDPTNGRLFFYGHLVGGGKNFVGNWRFAGSDPNMPAYEGALCMGKREEI
ncbi:hypothetical protein VNI00_013953 [Paramarasmius palmivorus]|uniref:F-box domain-containing protein n=1 Tax=Paramarasmius palmivorus TaxID=297713 RepID=A0AAW0BVM6_9AGAR